MTKNFKIINDPLYGYIHVRSALILQLIDHPWMQRLRRIRQCGFIHLVYPGALHSRFHHLLGAYHLANRTVDLLRMKGISISTEEEEAFSAALLLHDMGHGPFSHSMEGMLIPVPHERISLAYIRALNDQMDGRLGMCISMFEGSYDRPFFHELISSQVDLDRMDYLARDSFYTGVYEGHIGQNRLIHLMNVCDGHLVFEEKAIPSIENFLLARSWMYEQVYQHHTVLAAEQMLRIFVSTIEPENFVSEQLSYFRSRANELFEDNLDSATLNHFAELDDTDILFELKRNTTSENKILNILANGLIQRQIFKVKFFNTREERDQAANSRLYEEPRRWDLLLKGEIQEKIYDPTSEQIRILGSRAKIVGFSTIDKNIFNNINIKYYLCFPNVLKASEH